MATWNSAGGITGAVLGGGTGAAVGSALGAGADAIGLGGAPDLGGIANGLANQFGNPGHSNFNATAFQNNPNSGYDPNAFQGGWQDPNSAYNPAQLAQNAQNAQNQQAPGFAQAQAGQTQLEQLLMGQANGTAPSLAQAQLKQAQQTNAANTMALQAQSRGLNPGQAALNAGNINATANQQTAAQGVQAGLAERNMAQGQLGNVLQQQGGMGLNQQAQNNQMVQYYMSQGMSAEQAQLQAQIAQQQILAGSYNNAQGLNAGVSIANAGNSANLIGGLLSGGASAGMGALTALAGGGSVPGYAAGGVLQPIHPGIVAQLRASGGTIPGRDPGMDTVTDGRIGLRPGEVVVNQENPEYPRAKAAVEGAQAGGMQGPSRISAIARAIMSAYNVGGVGQDRSDGMNAVAGSNG